MPGNLITFLGVLLAGLTAVILTFKMRGRLREAGEREGRLRAFMREQSNAIRAMARETLHLRRHVGKATREIESLSQDYVALKEKVKQAEGVDRRLYVLDDRRTQVDTEFIISMAHPNYKRHVSPKATAALSMAWSTGRRYVVWAVDKDRALDKINARMPKEQGYVICAVAQRDGDG